jgi:hypothetical protein
MFAIRPGMWVEIIAVAAFLAYMLAPAFEHAFEAGAELVAEHQVLATTTLQP